MSHRIVVVDDEPDIRGLVTLTLELAGHTVDQAVDGESALALITATPPDLVVLDVMLPGIDGHEVARRLAADPTTATIPILMLSARGQAKDVEAALASGASMYIVKPFTPRDLAQQVGKLLVVK